MKDFSSLKLSCKIHVLHDGASKNPFINIDSSDNIISTVTYTGHLYKGRGIEIIESLAMNYPNLIFNIYGGESDLVSEYRKRNFHQSNLIFHGHVPNSQIPEILAKSDILIAPYQTNVFLKNGLMFVKKAGIVHVLFWQRGV